MTRAAPLDTDVALCPDLGGHTVLVARRVTSARLVGRTDGLATLRSAITAAGEGNTRVVLVAGDAGIG
jgi:hypothetical protein